MNIRKKLLRPLFILACFFGIFLSSSASYLFAEETQKNEIENKVLVVRTNHTFKAKVESFKEQAKSFAIQVDSKPVSQLKDLKDASRLFNQYDLVLFDGASQRESKKQFDKFVSVVQQKATRFHALKWQDQSFLNNNVSKSHAKKLFHYYDNGGVENFKRMAAFLQKRLFNQSRDSVADPIIYPEVGIYHPKYPGLIFSKLNEYLKWKSIDINKTDENQRVIGIMLQRALVESSQTDVIDSTIAAFEAKGAIVVPFFFEVSPHSSPYQHMISSNGKTFVDMIVNFRTIHWANKRKVEFEEIGVPVVQALTYYTGNQKAWEEDKQGISSGMTPFLLVLPETSGVIDPQIIAARNDVTEKAEVIDYQLEHMVNKALNLAKLKHKPNAQKKIAVFFWGDRDMGASFLNVPDSLHVISHELSRQGYQVSNVEPAFFTDRVNQILNPFYRDYQLKELLDADLADLMPVSDYLAWFNTLPRSVTEPVNQQWGHAKNNFMVVEHQSAPHFVMPRIRNGNMLIMRQPPRADDKDQDKMLYHKGDVPMNHYYLAAYYYARKFWNSDAVIHLGTHGSQEYLGGKERGLSKYDGPNLAVWDTPVFYPFIVDDVGEAMQTKRRGSATVISHMTPPYAAAGLQGDTADIHELMHQYKALDRGGVKVKTADQIIQKCVESNICKDLDWNESRIRTDFNGFLEVLHDYLGELAAENQPLGLHSFGELAEKRLIISTLTQMLGSEFAALATEFESEHSGEHHKQSHHHHDGKTDHSHDNEKAHNSDDHYHETATELEKLAGYQTVRDFIVNASDHIHDGHKLESHDMDEKLLGYIKRGKELYKNLKSIKELKSLVSGLNGEYIAVKTGGDPIRHPDSVPTGLNLYGFDPSRLPTKAAYQQGQELVEKVINDYYREHKRYPDKLAFSLWSIEAMRHYGVLESQALYAMGVKPKWSEDGRVIGTEIIPASELKRPRVDVVLSATGLYRDAFPNVVQRLAKAIESVAQLKEDNNSVWENTQRIKAELLKQGQSEDDALYLASVRIFSSASGQYGSGTDGPVFASDTWDTDKKISDNYLSKMGYAFGTDAKRWGQQIDGLDLYGKQLSGTDVALFSRSSNLYGMLSSDDPFEYFGSLSLAVRNLDGKSPKMLIANLRDAERGNMQDAAQFLAKELRTRQFHKRWITEMQKEGYSGAVSMASQVANFWGWQVVDPNLVRDDQWQTFHEIYVNDSLNLKIQEWFEKVNPGAQAQLIERMLEAVRKDYWQASEQTQKELVQRYLELVNQFDLFVDNEKLREFANQSASGFGLNIALPVVAPDASVNPQQPQQVEGQKLEQVQPPSKDKEWNMNLIFTLLISFTIVLIGGMVQARRSYRFSPI